VCERVEDVVVGAGTIMELISLTRNGRRDERSSESPSDETVVLEVVLSGNKEPTRDESKDESNSGVVAALESDAIWKVWSENGVVALTSDVYSE
jgi:hypothetical protein